MQGEVDIFLLGIPLRNLFKRNSSMTTWGRDPDTRDLNVRRLLLDEIIGSTCLSEEKGREELRQMEEELGRR